jgi:hypothetical protein
MSPSVALPRQDAASTARPWRLLCRCKRVPAKKPSVKTLLPWYERDTSRDQAAAIAYSKAGKSRGDSRDGIITSGLVHAAAELPGKLTEGMNRITENIKGASEQVERNRPDKVTVTISHLSHLH